LSHKQELDNFTVVIEKQTKGKGQMGSVWEAEEVRI
jgi:BirA family biotin operon repressor/biotin-[acetyl-CoA-carboxylase] ligase